MQKELKLHMLKNFRKGTSKNSVLDDHIFVSSKYLTELYREVALFLTLRGGVPTTF